MVRVELLEGGDAWVYVLFEHKSHPDPRVGFQLLRHVTRLGSAPGRPGRFRFGTPG